MWHPCYSPSDRIILNIHDLFTCHFSQHLTEHNKIYFSNCAQILQDHSCWNLLRVTYFTKKTSNSEPTNFLVNTDNYWKIWFSKSDLNGLFIVFFPSTLLFQSLPQNILHSLCFTNYNSAEFITFNQTTYLQLITWSIY